jgi:hypothetical protein
MAEDSKAKIIARFGGKTWTVAETQKFLDANPEAKSMFFDSIKRGVQPAAALEQVVSLGKDILDEPAAEPEPKAKAKKAAPKAAGPLPPTPTDEAPVKGGKEALTTREANTDFGARITAKAFKAVKAQVGEERWRTLDAASKLKLVLAMPEVNALKGSAATGAIRALGTRIGTTRGGEALAPEIETWGKARGVVKPTEEFGVVIKETKAITNTPGLTAQEKSALRVRTRTIAKRRGKGVTGGASEERIGAPAKEAARVSVKSSPSTLDELIASIIAETEAVTNAKQTASDEGAKYFLLETGETDENGKPKKIRVRIDEKGGAKEPGTTRKGEAETLSVLGEKQNRKYNIETTRASWKAYNDAAPKGGRLSAKEFVDLTFKGVDAKEKRVIIRALRDERLKERVNRQQGTGVKPAKPKKTKLIDQTAEEGKARLDAPEAIRVRKQNTPTMADVTPSAPVASEAEITKLIKSIIAGEAIPEGSVKGATRGPKRTASVTRKPTFQDAVLAQLSETGGKKDVRDFMALKALRKVGFGKAKVRAQAKTMGVSQGVMKAARSAGLLSIVQLAMSHLDGESKRKKRD